MKNEKATDVKYSIVVTLVTSGCFTIIAVVMLCGDVFYHFKVTVKVKTTNLAHVVFQHLHHLGPEFSLSAVNYYHALSILHRVLLFIRQTCCLHNKNIGSLPW